VLEESALEARFAFSNGFLCMRAARSVSRGPRRRRGPMSCSPAVRSASDVRLDVSFAMAGLGMKPTRLEQDIGAWRTEGTSKGVAMAGSARFRLNGDELTPNRRLLARWTFTS
jgi:hypothetical protein